MGSHPSPPEKKKRYHSLSKTFFMLSLFHAVFAAAVFLILVVLFSLFGGDVIRFWKRYRHNANDARSAFTPVVFLGGWAIVFTFALWDYCALGALLAAAEQRNYGSALRRPYSLFWCFRSAGTNERLTDACHGCCDHPVGRIFAIAVRLGVVSAMLTISGMTAITAWQMDEIRSDEQRVYKVAMVIGGATLLEWPLTVSVSIFHSIFTYYWIKNWHQVEVMAMELSIRDDSTSTSTGSHDFD